MGGGNCGSATAPTATPRKSGLRSSSQNTVLPHVGKKWRRAFFPSPTSRTYRVNGPAVCTCASNHEAPCRNLTSKLCGELRIQKPWHLYPFESAPRKLGIAAPIATTTIPQPQASHPRTPDMSQHLTLDSLAARSGTSPPTESRKSRRAAHRSVQICTSTDTTLGQNATRPRTSTERHVRR